MRIYLDILFNFNENNVDITKKSFVPKVPFTLFIEQSIINNNKRLFLLNMTWTCSLWLHEIHPSNTDLALRMDLRYQKPPYQIFCGAGSLLWPWSSSHSLNGQVRGQYLKICQKYSSATLKAPSATFEAKMNIKFRHSRSEDETSLCGEN